MIVVCRPCGTRFQLADERIPTTGLRVCCSVCQHTFEIEGPGDPSEQAPAPLADVSEPVLPASLDPDDGNASGPTDPVAAADSRPLDLQEQSPQDVDWEFNTPIQPEAATDNLDAAACSDSGEELLDHWLDADHTAAAGAPSLGAAQAWDAESPLDSPARVSDPGGSISQDETEPQASPSALLASSAESPTAEPSPVAEGLRPPVHPGNALGWLCVAVLVITALIRGVVEPLWHAVSPAQVAERAVGVSLDGAWIPNASGEPVFVVTGRVSERSMSVADDNLVPTLQLLDASGRRVGGSVIAGPVLADGSLGSIPPDQITRSLEQAALVRARAGRRPEGSWSFQAVLPELPVDAAFYRLEWKAPSGSPRELPESSSPRTLAASAFRSWDSRR